MKQIMSYAEASERAQAFCKLIEPACERIEVAGSLRRRKAEIGDIEIVAIPRMEVRRDLFGEPVESWSLLDGLLADLGLEPLKNGGKFKQFVYEGTTVDLFLPTAETWGVIFTLRTGSAGFSHWLVTPQFNGGAMPNGMFCRGGRLWRGWPPLETSEEEDVFHALGLNWLPPEEREKGRWTR